MRFPFDPELIVFFYTIFKVLGSLPRLRRSATPIPVRYEIEEINPLRLTEAQERYLAPYDKNLAAMNYWPVCTYRIANYGHNLLRNYINPAETSRCVILIHELKIGATGKASPVNSCTMSFHTRFTDGTILTTRNMRIKSVLDRPPYQVVQERPGIDEPAEMKQEHDSKVRKMGTPVQPPSNVKAIFEDIQSEHARFNEYQLAQGAYRLQADGKCFVTTDKVRWRGIRNHLNPFAHRIPVRRFLPAALLAVFLPLLTVLKVAPAVAEAARMLGLPPLVAGGAVILAAYLIAGAAIGYVLERQTFVWVFLLTYVTVRLIAGADLGPFPFSTFAGSIAYSVALAKKRRRAVLLPQQA